MSAAEIKFQLHQLIENTNDTSLLDKAYTALSKLFTKQHTVDWWDTISLEEKQGIEEGLKDIEQGRIYSHEQVMKELKTEFPSAFNE